MRVEVENFDKDVFSLSSNQNVLFLKRYFFVNTDVLLGSLIL